MANPDIPLCDLASLNWVSHKVPSYPAYEKLTIELLLPVWYNSVHTHIFFSLSFPILSYGLFSARDHGWRLLHIS
jgi:hypothetical protein